MLDEEARTTRPAGFAAAALWALRFFSIFIQGRPCEWIV